MESYGLTRIIIHLRKSPELGDCREIAAASLLTISNL